MKMNNSLFIFIFSIWLFPKANDGEHLAQVTPTGRLQTSGQNPENTLTPTLPFLPFNACFTCNIRWKVKFRNLRPARQSFSQSDQQPISQSDKPVSNARLWANQMGRLKDNRHLHHPLSKQVVPPLLFLHSNYLQRTLKGPIISIQSYSLPPTFSLSRVPPPPPSPSFVINTVVFWAIMSTLVL